ncbi:MAG: response regulator transcription factor [Actinomycetes bacterium]
MAQVLVVEDDPAIRTAVLRALDDLGHAVSSASDALSGLRTALETTPDIVILDLGLPDIDGSEMLRMLRAVSDVPVIVATARDDDPTAVRALNSGADDFLAKPFSAEQLDARIRAVLRRTQTSTPHVELTAGAIVLSPAARTASLEGEPLDLTPREFDLLQYLMERPNTVIGKRELLTEVWRMAPSGADKTVDVHVSWLRRKLGETAAEPQYLHTVRGVGLKLAAPMAE